MPAIPFLDSGSSGPADGQSSRSHACHSARLLRHRPASAASSTPPRACWRARQAIRGASICCRCGCGVRWRRTWTSSNCCSGQWRPRRPWRIADEGSVSLTGSDGSDTPVFTGKVDGIHERPHGLRLVTATNGSRELAQARLNRSFEQQDAGAIIEALASELGFSSELPGDAPTLPRFVVDDRLSLYGHIARLAALSGCVVVHCRGRHAEGQGSGGRCGADGAASHTASTSWISRSANGRRTRQRCRSPARAPRAIRAAMPGTGCARIRRRISPPPAAAHRCERYSVGALRSADDGRNVRRRQAAACRGGGDARDGC